LSVLITGASGQDGRLLAYKLLGEGKRVFGLCRPGKKAALKRYCPLLTIIEVDLTDQKKLTEILDFVKPEEIYNFAGFSSVIRSWQDPSLVTTVNCLVPATILNWSVKNQPTLRLLQASSSEIFGGGLHTPQNANTPLSPVTPYGLSKSFTHSLIQQFRSEYGLHASNAILYNHESPLRDFGFVTRKITSAVAAISRGSKEPIRLGQMSSKRDWGWAPDYVDAMQRIVQQDVSGDYIISTGVSHSVADVLTFAFDYIGVADYSRFIEHDQGSDRRIDPNNLVGDNSQTSKQLDWKPSKDLRQVIGKMIDFDLMLIDSPEAQWFPSFGDLLEK
jgi:GDPmannose 4,6-dehydratase